MNNDQVYNGGGSMVAPVAPAAPVAPPSENKKVDNKIFLIIGLVVAIITALVFIGLFIWMFLRYDSASTNLSGQINEAVAIAVNENSTKLEAEFAEREKETNRTFSGPEDYGELNFKYPKTWNLYVQSDAANGGTYQAYFNPGQVGPISATSPNALTLIINTQSFESVTKTYESYVNSGRMTMKTLNINGSFANLYTGTLSNNLSGAVCLIKIRDKTVILQTESELYMEDFLKLLETVTYNS